MKKKILIAIFLISSTILRAQDEDKFPLVPINAIKFSPLHLLNFYPTLELSYERHVLKNFTLQLEAGYVLNYRTFSPAYQNKRGVKLKLEPRYYFYQTTRRVLYYVAFEFYQNIINFDRETTELECFDVDCTNQFNRTYNYTVHYREYGGTFKVGFTLNLNKIILDFNGGLSIRSISYDDPFNTRRSRWTDAWTVGPIEAKRVVPGPNLGIRLGYRFN